MGISRSETAGFSKEAQDEIARQAAATATVKPTRRFARAQPRHTPGTMNKTEAAYAAELERRKAAGEIQWFAFEAMKLRLAKLTTYTPDFVVQTADDTLECHEVKGFWQDDARAKIKIAAELYPFRFLAVTQRAKRDGGGWKVEEFRP